MYIQLGTHATYLNEKRPLNVTFMCPEEDLNLHPVKDMALNHARLPVPPSGLIDTIIVTQKYTCQS